MVRVSLLRCHRRAPLIWRWSVHNNHRVEDAMERKRVNVLLISESEQACRHLAASLEQKGCECWFASKIEDVRLLLDQRPFHLVLSTRPMSQGSPLRELLSRAGCMVFYSYPVEDSCLWLPASPRGRASLEAPALRPSEFVRALDRIVTEVDRKLPAPMDR